MKQTSLASRWNADLIDQNYSIWLQQPESLDPEWRAFFEGFELASSEDNGGIRDVHPSQSDSDATKQARAIGLIYAYRSIGHTIAKINPLSKEAPINPRLTLERLGFSEKDLDQVIHTGNYLGGVEMPSANSLNASKKPTATPSAASISTYRKPRNAAGFRPYRTGVLRAAPQQRAQSPHPAHHPRSRRL